MSFSRVIGQHRPLRILRGILKTGRLSTSYLFSGEKGVGKFTTAMEFAKALNCERPGEEGACDHCSSCVKTESLNHPDLKVIVPDGGIIKIEQVREVEEFLSFTPYEGRKKIVVLDDAESMNTFAENAFLKTLEEPPPESMILLISSRPEMLEDTIRSRCMHVRFLPLSEGELEKAAELMGGKKIPEAALKLAMGRVGLLADEETVTRRGNAFKIFEEMISGKSMTPPKEKEEIEELIDYFLLFLRDMAVFSSTGEGSRLLNRDLSQKFSELCKETDLKGIIKNYRDLNELKRRAGYNLNKSVLFNYLCALLALMGRAGKKATPETGRRQ